MPELFEIDKQMIPEEVTFLLGRLADHGCEAYVVGGAVRDLLLGLKPSDFDLTTSATPDELQTIFADLPLILAGLKHGTVGVILHHEPFEITTFREDSTYQDHRRPDRVNFTTDLAKDLVRRDFTINALAWNPSLGLLDYVEGLPDLQNGVIRCVGEPFRRFDEDALRIMRAYRLAATYGFTIEAETVRAARHLFQDLDFVAPERILTEFRRLLCGRHFADQLAFQKDMVNYIFPELSESSWDLLTSDAFRCLPENFVLRLSLIGSLLPESVRRETATRLRLSRNESNGFLNLSASVSELPPPASEHLLRLARDHFVELADWRVLLEALGTDPEYLESVDRALAEIQEKKLPQTPEQLAINGNILQEMGWKPGPAIGQTLEDLWSEVIRGELANEAAALRERAARSALF